MLRSTTVIFCKIFCYLNMPCVCRPFKFQGRVLVLLPTTAPPLGHSSRGTAGGGTSRFTDGVLLLYWSSSTNTGVVFLVRLWTSWVSLPLGEATWAHGRRQKPLWAPWGVRAGGQNMGSEARTHARTTVRNIQDFMVPFFRATCPNIRGKTARQS
jgi:hypothetical protein